MTEETRPLARPPQSFAEKRAAVRAPHGFSIADQDKAPFDLRLAWDLALQLDPAEDVFRRYGVEPDDAMALMALPLFQDTLRRFKREIEENGGRFRAKARIQAEELIDHSFLMATDPEAPPAVRADLIKWTAKMGGLEPPAKKDEGSTGGGFNFQIVFSGAPPQAIGGTTINTIEGERT